MNSGKRTRARAPPTQKCPPTGPYCGRVDGISGLVGGLIGLLVGAAAIAAFWVSERTFRRLPEQPERELDDAKEHADEAVAHTRNGWEQMRADAKTRAAELKAEARTRREKHDADLAASDAELGEAEAAAAVDYAAWAIEAAELAILDALYLRARADEKAAEVTVSA